MLSIYIMPEDWRIVISIVAIISILAILIGAVWLMARSDMRFIQALVALFKGSTRNGDGK